MIAELAAQAATPALPISEGVALFLAAQFIGGVVALVKFANRMREIAIAVLGTPDNRDVGLVAQLATVRNEVNYIRRRVDIIEPRSEQRRHGGDDEG